MRLHAIVTDFEAAVRAVEGGATVIQLRLKGAPTGDVIETGRPFVDLPATFVVNDDVDAALTLGADGVHLGRGDPGAERVVEHGLMLGTSASSRTRESGSSVTFVVTDIVQRARGCGGRALACRAMKDSARRAAVRFLTGSSGRLVAFLLDLGSASGTYISRRLTRGETSY